jgi:hypothetical protein
VFFFVPYSEVLPKEVQWFWEAVEEGELPFAYDEDAGPRLDSHPLEDGRSEVGVVGGCG